MSSIHRQPVFPLETQRAVISSALVKRRAWAPHPSCALDEMRFDLCMLVLSKNQSVFIDFGL